MPATGHPTPADLQAFVLGTLPDPAAVAVESHLSECPACQQAAAAATDDTLVSLLRSAETSQAGPVTPGTGFAETVGLSPSTDAEPRPAELDNHPRYRPIRPLGRGGMGHVWLAEHTVMGRPVALKLVRPEFLDRPEAVERFRREVKHAARLNHPNIVAAHDAEQAGGTHFLVMEFIDGDTLAERIAAGPVSVEDACRWMIDAARGLEHARLQGLIHRDVKPHNLIRERATGRVKVLDFGLAGVTAAGEASGLTGGNVVIGTPDYIAPEQAVDARKADTRSDVYSLGCTLYHLLAGRPPFPGDTVLQKIDAHRHDEPGPVTAVRRDLTPALAELVARMMAKDPSQRPQTPGEVATALEDLLAGRGGEPPMPARRRDDGAGERGRRWLLRRIGQVAVITLGVLVGAVVYKLTDEADISVDNEAPDQVKWVIKKDGYVVSEPSSALSTSFFLPAGGEYTVELDRPDEFVAHPKSFAVRRGEKLTIRVVRVSREPQPAAVGPAAPARSGPPIEPARFLLHGKPDSKFTDLIPYVDPSADREAGSLGSYGEAFLAVASDKAGPARIALPARPEGDYEVRARVARLSGDGSFNLMLPVPGTDGRVQVGALVDTVRDGDAAVTLDWPAGPAGWLLKTLRHRLQPQRQHLVLARVTRAGERVQIHIAVDGVPVLEWTGPADATRNGSTAFTRDRRQIGIGVTAAEFRIDRLEMRVLNGTADLSRPTKPTSGPPAEWTNLLKGLNLPTAILDGTWGWSGGFGDTSLIAGSPKAGKSGRMAFPARPNGDYEVRARFQRVVGDDCLTVMLPIPGHPGMQTALVVDGYAAQGGFVGLEYVNKQPVGRPIKDTLGGRLQNKTTYTLHVRVTARDGKATVRAEINDQPVLAWTGRVADLTPSFNWFTPDRGQLGLGVWDTCQFRIESLELRASAAPGQTVAAAAAGSPFAAAPEQQGVVRVLKSKGGRWHFGAQVAPDGRTFLVPGGSEVAVYETATGRLLHAMPGWLGGYAMGGRKVVVMHIGPGDNCIRVYDLATGALDHSFGRFDGATWAFVTLPDQPRIVAWAADKVARLFDLTTGAELATWKFDTSVEFCPTPDGRRMLYRAPGEARYTVYDTATGKPVDELAAVRGLGKVQSFSADGLTVLDDATGTIHRTADGAAVGKAAPLPAGAVIGHSPDRTRTVVRLADSTVQVRDTVSRAVVSTLPVEFASPDSKFVGVLNRALTPDGRYTALTTTDGDVAVIRLPDPAAVADSHGLLRRFARFKGGIHHLLLSPDGTHAFASDDEVVKWNVQTGETEWVAAQPGGSSLALSGDGTVLTVWAQDGTARVLDPATGNEQRQFPIPKLPVRNAVINKTGTRAFVSQRSDDKEAKPIVAAWDVTAGRELFKLNGITAETYGLALSPDGTQLVTGSFDKQVILWDAIAGKVLGVLGDHGAEVSCVAFSADGKYVVSGGRDNQLRVWSVEQRHCVSLLTGHSAWLFSAAFTPDGTRVVSGTGSDGRGDGVRVWDWRTGEQLAHYSEARGIVGSVAATPDGRQAVTAEDNGQIRVWRLPPPAAPVAADAVGPVRRFGRFLSGIPGIAMSKDGRFVYAMEEDAAVVKWDRTAATVAWAHKLPEVGGFQVAATADDKYVVAGCKDGTARVLDAATGKEVRRFIKHQERILAVAVAPDGKRAATTSGNDQPPFRYTVRVWEIDTATELFELNGTEAQTWAIRFSPDGHRIATASDDGKVRLWDAKTGALEHTFTGHRGAASGVVFSPDGKRLASSGQDLTVRLWDVEKRVPIRSLEGHTVWVSDLAFTPDGSRLLSVGANWNENASDGLRVWDAADGTPLYKGAAGRTEDVGLAVGPDGRFAVTGGMTGALWEWRLPEVPKR